jgi:hypothetical protein
LTTELISQPYHLPRDGGPALWHLGALLTFKATSEQTAGRMWAKELLAPRGMATPDGAAARGSAARSRRTDGRTRRLRRHGRGSPTCTGRGIAMGERSYVVVTTSPAPPERVFDLLADAPG